MSKFVKILDGKRVFAFALAGAAAALLAGCSSDVGGLSNPFADSARLGGTDAMATGSLAPPAPIGESAPVSPTISQAPVAAVASAPLAPVRAQPLNYQQSAYEPPTRPLGSERPIAAPAFQPPVEHDHAVYKAPHGQWAADGGVYVTVRHNENAATLAKRYDVPLMALIRVNGLQSAAQIHPGSRVVIPVYTSNSGLREERDGGHQRHADSRDDHRGDRHSVASRNSGSGRTDYHFVKGPSSAYDAHDRRKQADSDRHPQKSERDARLRQKASESKRDVASDDRNQRVASNDSSDASRSSRGIEPERASTAGLASEAKKVVASSEHPDFRWPVRGRIIAGFKPGVNDGINIAVPDGTNVRAVDDGVVAYAGDELKGYGNLVLIRHPNGFVSAYADNGKLEVKLGQTVRRGQVIAKSGQSGNVSSPQLHFELRKGQKPVNPTQFLAGS